MRRIAVVKMVSTFARWVMWRSVFLVLGTGSLVTVRVTVGLGLSASKSFIADCRQAVPGDWLPVAAGDTDVEKNILEHRYSAHFQVTRLTCQSQTVLLSCSLLSYWVHHAALHIKGVSKNDPLCCFAKISVTNGTFSPKWLEMIWNDLPQKPVARAVQNFHKCLQAWVFKAGGHFEHSVWLTLC